MDFNVDDFEEMFGIKLFDYQKKFLIKLNETVVKSADKNIYPLFQEEAANMTMKRFYI